MKLAVVSWADFCHMFFINFRKMCIGEKRGSMQTLGFIDFITKTSMPPSVRATVRSICLGSMMHNYEKSRGITKNCHFVPVCYHLMFLSLTLLICEMG